MPPLSTGGAGSVYLFAGNAATDASSPEVDGINVDGTISSQTGDLLLSSQHDIRFTQDIRSGQGHVGLLAGGDMLQLADVTTDGDVWLRAGGSLSMTGGTTTSAGATLLLQSGSALELGSVTAQQVALQAGGDILDHNGADVVNVQSSALSMTAGGMIGHSDTGQPNPEVNAQALDLQVTTVAALSSSGIYLQQLTAGGDLTVGTVAPVGVSIAITQPRFNSSSDSVPLFASVSRVSDLTTSSGGPIKVAVRDGSLIIQDGSDGNGRGVHAVGAGDVLLWASQDIVTQASITSGSGHITLQAGDDIDLNAPLSTGGAGSVYLFAGNAATDASSPEVDGINVDGTISSQTGDLLLSSQHDIRFTQDIRSGQGHVGLLAGGDMLQLADVTTDGDVWLRAGGSLSMTGGTTTSAGATLLLQSGSALELGSVTAQQVALQAGGDILDHNGADVVNVQSSALSMTAGGMIGHSDTGQPNPEVNAQALDLQVTTVAALSSSGIYLQQLTAGGDLTVGTVAPVGVSIAITQPRFNSSSDSVPLFASVSRVSDLTTSSAGPIKVAVRDGSLIIQDGSDGNGRGVHAVGAGDVLLWASQDIVTQASITSGSGHITLQAGDDIDLNASLSTGGAGSVYLFAGNAATDASSPEVDGINVDGTIRSQTGDLLLSSQHDIRFTQDIRSGQGHVGLLAGGDMLQLADVTTDGDVWLRAGGSLSMTGGTTTSAGTTLLLQSGSALELGSVTAQQVALQAGGDILDHNGADIVNVQSNALSMTAGGMIGHSDTGQPNPEVNAQALDLQVTTVAALSSSGIYLQQLTAGGDLTVGTVAPVGVSIAITQPRFNSSSDSVPLFASVSRVSDLTTSSGGPIKVAVRDGSLIIQDGSDGNGRGVHAVGAGDVLLWASQDIVTQASITSGSGHLTLQAGDDIDLNASLSTGGAGSVYLFAGNAASDASSPEVDGINVDGTIGSQTGDLLLSSQHDIRFTQDIRSGQGHVGLLAGGDMLQLADVTTDGDVWLRAGGSLSMTGGTTTSAGTTLLLQSGSALELGSVTAQQVALQAGGDILDHNGADVVNVQSSALSMTAGGMIGHSDTGQPNPDVNAQALDLQVTTVAALSSSGIYLQQLTAGGDLTVGTVAPFNVTIQIAEAKFNSTHLAVQRNDNVDQLSDLRTSQAGPIKVAVLGGSLMIVDGANRDGVGVEAVGNGDVLLHAAQDIELQSIIYSGGGHVTVSADDDILQAAAIVTSGGDILLFSMNKTADGLGLDGVIMTDAGTSRTEGGLIRIESVADIVLGRLDTVDADRSRGAVSLLAGRSILDGTGDLDELNVQSGTLRMEAHGMIGRPQIDSPAPNVNLNAIDTQVDVVAGFGHQGIYLRESDGLKLDTTGVLTGVVVNFNSTTSSISDLALADLVSESGSIKLQSTRGEILIYDGDANGSGIHAQSSAGDVLLQTLGENGDIVLHAALVSQGGHVGLVAGDDVQQFANISTTSTGTVAIIASNRAGNDRFAPTDNTGNGFSMLAGTSIRTGGGDVRAAVDNEGDIRLAVIETGNGNLGNISLAAEGSIIDAAAESQLTAQAAAGQNQVKLLDATGFQTHDLVTLYDGATNAELHRIANVQGDTLTFIGNLNTSLTTATRISTVNLHADSARLIADAAVNTDGSIAESMPGDQRGSIGAGDATSPQATINGRALDTLVSTLAARSADGIYVQEFDDLVIANTRAVSVVQPGFSSHPLPIVDGSLAGLVTTDNGSIKVDSYRGNLVVMPGSNSTGNNADGVGISAGGRGDVLLSARGPMNSVTIDSGSKLHSGSGNISLLATRNVTLRGEIATGGSGTVYVRAGNDQDLMGGLETYLGDILLDAGRDLRMSVEITSAVGNVGLVVGRDVRHDASITAGRDFFATVAGDVCMGDTSTIVAGRNLLIHTGTETTEGTQTLGSLVADNISLDATGDILDGNGTDKANLHGNHIRLVADSNLNLDGKIGRSAAPLDLEANSVAARSFDGIYLHQLSAGGDLTIEYVPAVNAISSVRQVNFNSTTTDVSQAAQIGALGDLETSVPEGSGARAIKLSLAAGDLTIKDGPDLDERGVLVRGFGSVLLATEDAGNIALKTGIETAGTARDGVVSLAAFGWIDELSRDGTQSDSAAAIVADSLVVTAGEYVHLHHANVNSLSASVGANGLLDSPWQRTNSKANDKGDDFLDALGPERIDFATTNGVMTEYDPNLPLPDTSDRVPYDSVARQFRFQDTYQDAYALFLQNAKPLEVTSIQAGSSAAPNVYIETLGVTADLNIAGQLRTTSSTATEGGIVLVAGRELDMQGELITEATLAPGVTRTQIVNQIGNGQVQNDAGSTSIAYLDAAAQNAGQGVPTGDLRLTTTEFVIRDQALGLSAAAEDYRTQVFQRVILQFGFAGEAGFVSFTGYADGEVQQFDVAGEEGVRTKSVNELNPADQNSILAVPQTVEDAAAFTRAIAFENAYIDANQTLPTVAIIRRAGDFFLFENAAAESPAEIRDMTFETFEIENVVTLGAQGATELPRDPESVGPPPVIAVPIVDQPPAMVQLVNADLELIFPRERDVEVAIYRVFYDDLDQNGQADDNELPTAEQIVEAKDIEREVVEFRGLASGEREKLKIIETKSGGSPTAEEIELAKNDLLSDPLQPSGAYAIVERGVDDKEVVLDIFSMRDVEESVEESEQPIIQLKLDDAAIPADDPSTLPEPDADDAINDGEAAPANIAPDEAAAKAGHSPQPDGVSRTRFSTSTMLAGSIWFASVASSRRVKPLTQPIAAKDEGKDKDSHQVTRFDRKSRRKRRWQRGRSE